MELAAHSRHASAEKMFNDIEKGPSKDIVLRRQESCPSGGGSLSLPLPRPTSGLG